MLQQMPIYVLIAATSHHISTYGMCICKYIQMNKSYKTFLFSTQHLMINGRQFKVWCKLFGESFNEIT